MGFSVEFFFFSTSSVKAYLSNTLVANPFLPGPTYAGSNSFGFVLSIFSISHHVSILYRFGRKWRCRGGEREWGSHILEFANPYLISIMSRYVCHRHHLLR